MYKTIGALLLSCFLIAEGRYDLSVESDASQDVLIDLTEKKISYRLSETVVPKSYYIKLKVNLEDENQDRNFTFCGAMNIALSVEKATKNITLHSKDLNITDLSIDMVNGDSRQSIGVNYSVAETTEFFNDTNFLTITKKDSVEFESGQYVLRIMYKGKLSDDLTGFYRSYYLNNEGKPVWLASTKFEPIHARRAFPCFDEPGLKATFQLKITHSNQLKAVSNTKSIATTDNKDGTTTTEFEKTPLMSTYLVAVVVSDLKAVQTSANNFTVYVRPNSTHLGNLAVKKGLEILKKLEEFTNIPFETEIGKMDQVAIPQFPSGAMENWGLVTYREGRLLYDEEKSTSGEKQSTIQIIAHEFSHQWFGNLVSPKWWRYIWLNEGFASFFSHYITDQVEKSFRSVEQSVVDTIQMVLTIDSRYGTYPINMDAETPVDIMRKFSFITYRKGMAIIRMMQHYLTDEIFKKGLQRYLNDFRHKAVDSDDLFNSIQKVLDEEKLNINIKAVMDAWINEGGYPLVTVKRNYENNSMILMQERFITNDAAGEGRKNNVWSVPISYAIENNPDFENTSANVLFRKAEETFPVDGAEKNQWIILNKQQTGFYRVNYDEENWKLIINYLNSVDREKIHPLNRAELIDDAFALVEEKMLDLRTLIQLTAQMRYETDYIPWNSAEKVLNYLKRKVLYSKHYPHFKEFSRNVTASVIKSVGFEATDNDDHIKKLHSLLTLTLTCHLRLEDCVSLMGKKLDAWLKDEKKIIIIPQHLNNFVFCHGLRNANSSLWEVIFNKTKSDAYDSGLKSAMVEGLGCSNQKEILDRYLLDSLADESCKDIFMVIYQVLRGSEVGLDAVLDFVVPNIFKLYWKKSEKDELINLISNIGAEIKTKEQLAKFKEMENSGILLPNDLIAGAVTFAEKNIEWLRKHDEVLTSEFKIKSTGIPLLSVPLSNNFVNHTFIE